MGKRQELINVAISFLGRNEADGSHKEIIDLYNSITPLPVGYKMNYKTDAWCAAFVSAAAKKAGMTDIVYPECSCERMIALYKAAGRWEEIDSYSPLPGDIIFYDWGDSGSGDNTGYSDHVGIVVEKNGSILKVIEGNMSDKVGYRTIQVNGKYIRGYGLPNFGDDTATSTTASAATATAVTEKTVTLKVKQLKQGSTGAQVKAMQVLLIGKGFSCGADGADGDLGANTLTALKKFQKSAGLTVDGICGVNTWAALLGA